MINNGKRALITGIKGFTGHYMAAELSAAGYEIHGLGTQPDSSASHYHAVDLTNYQQVADAVMAIQPDVVVHLAAIAFVGHADANAFYQVNVGGTRNLLQALTQLPTKPESVLVASSANVYGNTTAGKLTELTPFNPANDYAVSKVAMEYLVALYADKLPINIVRPFNYTGCGQADNFLIPKIVKHFRERKDVIELGNIDVWRDFSDVRFIVSCYAQILKLPTGGMTLNVASGKMASLRDVIDLCEKITGHKIRIEVNPAFVRENEIKELCGDTEKLASLIPSFSPVPLETTLRWMLEN
ncbi:GDP-6-deoxy-D-lyxo-4-hexulose reductase [Erwinia typographi]|uniref:GDP-6-deoxy-D-lyxo-4-hexulose reductase n=1 Tax=Erwinia typographi TaxID=371042 RepID=A0A0A3ZAC2_9GAMM|nr:GDP-mannose 4,6-dehydratase [Erwinia typographi]KGT95845.1 GDP-6-deoxy-D-lyxo-4-hexulose reductase [Erwinia typographi]